MMQGSPSPKTPSPAGARLWRPAAQRNVRNSWSRFLAQKAAWASASSKALSVATSLVNAHLSLTYMSAMDLGVLKDMDGIRDKAESKLSRQQEEYLRQLLSCYKDLVDAVSHMVNTSKSMRTYVKGSVGSPLVEFCSDSGIDGDTGDGGGIAVFSSLSVPYFEMLGEEFAEMFVLELKVKRLLVVGFHSILDDEDQKAPCSHVMSWNDELYPGEFDSMKDLDNLSKVDCSSMPLRLNGLEVDDDMLGRPKGQTRREVLQVYLTAWLVEVNMNNARIEEIIAMVGEEMQITLV
eukprot:Gb_12758 [translate_table: standard]